ncbi:MAG: HAD-IB family hydrolase [Cytophagales bacterium]|nr:HAD-IB family hydrolase [Cytophagales bacterium]
MKKNKRLVLFDFDGTITKKDTLFAFIRFSVGWLRFYQGMLYLFPWLAAYKLRLIPAQKAKEHMLSYFFKGTSQQDFEKKTKAFTRKKLHSLIRPRALAAIAKHQQEGASVYVCSASANWINEWCRKQDLAVINSELDFDDKKIFSGKLIGRNCNGSEKLARILTIIDTSEFNEIIAYGDSKGDFQMFSIADKAHYKPFRKFR